MQKMRVARAVSLRFTPGKRRGRGSPREASVAAFAALSSAGPPSRWGWTRRKKSTTTRRGRGSRRTGLLARSDTGDDNHGPVRVPVDPSRNRCSMTTNERMPSLRSVQRRSPVASSGPALGGGTSETIVDAENYGRTRSTFSGSAGLATVGQIRTIDGGSRPLRSSATVVEAGPRSTRRTRSFSKN